MPGNVGSGNAVVSLGNPGGTTGSLGSNVSLEDGIGREGSIVPGGAPMVEKAEPVPDTVGSAGELIPDCKLGPTSPGLRSLWVLGRQGVNRRRTGLGRQRLKPQMLIVR